MEFYVWSHVDFTIPRIVWSWSGKAILFKQSEIVTDSDYPSKFTCMISNRGKASGTIISQRSEPVIVDSQEVKHLVLTAGHEIGNCFGNNKPNKIFSLCFESQPSEGRFYRAGVLHDFSSWQAEPLLDPITLYPYPLANDIAILAVENCDLNDLIEIPIADSIEEGDVVSVVGYPQEPDQILYSAPILRDYDVNDYTAKIYSAFHGFGRRVSSSGAVASKSGENLALVADYSSTSGQSGGAAYRIKNNEHELVGINIGGATLLYHWMLGQVISNIIQQDWDRATTLFGQVLAGLQSGQDYNYMQLEWTATCLSTAIRDRNGNNSIMSILSLMNLMAAWSNTPNQLTHNIAFPCYHPLMKTIKIMCQKFKALPRNTTFSSYSDLFQALN